jgi:hypothetical protein
LAGEGDGNLANQINSWLFSVKFKLRMISHLFFMKNRQLYIELRFNYLIHRVKRGKFKAAFIHHDITPVVTDAVAGQLNEHTMG